MARIAGIDIPREKKVPFSLSYIYGIGPATGQKICEKAKVDPEMRAGDMSEKQVTAIRKAITDLGIQVEGEKRTQMSMNVKRLKDIGCYRGLRHRRGLPVNGQRTKTNARTRKGRKQTVGLGKKAVGKKG